MKFSVRWKEAATDELAALWMDANSLDRRELTAVAREIDRWLQFNPLAVGESRADGRPHVAGRRTTK